MYCPAPQYDMYGAPPHHMPYPPPSDPRRDAQQQAQMNFNTPAPRQRTAIACRYCRRRKVSLARTVIYTIEIPKTPDDLCQIRCHGFDSSVDGRCTNCVRFHQECIFMPVSSQAHAFVPAHTAYPHLRNAGQAQQHPGGRPMYTPDGQPIIFGAHGQPLGAVPTQGQEQSYPPPQQSYPPHPYPTQAYDERGPPQTYSGEQDSRKRARADDSSQSSKYPPPTAGPSVHPYPQTQRTPGSTGRRGSGSTAATSQYEYPDPTGLAPVSPASSTTSYQSQQYPAQQAAQPYYPAPPSGRRSSPQSSYSYEQARASGSPHESTAGFSYASGLHPPQVLPPRDNGRTPPPGSRGDGNGNRAGMSVKDMLGPGDGPSRNSTDSDMLKALNKRGM